MKRMNKGLTVVFTAVAVLAFSASADLGLQQIINSQGVQAVGPVLTSAAQNAYASGNVQGELAAILNEAAQTGNADAVQYAIVAVMVAGGNGNLDIALAAINSSQAYSDFSELTATTVTETQGLMGGTAGTGTTGGTGGGQTGGGQTGGGAQQGGTGTQQQTGGGEQQGGGAGTGGTGVGGDSVNPQNPFSPESPGGEDGGDGDVEITDT